MGDCHNGRSITDLEYGMQYVWDKMATIMSDNRKGDNVGVITLRTDGTKNDLADTGDEYSNITLLRNLGMLEMGDLQSLKETVTPSDTEEGDAISAIVVAGEAIAKFTTLKTGKPGSFVRKIILLTDGQGEMNGEDVASIAERLDELKIALTVMYASLPSLVQIINVGIAVSISMMKVLQRRTNLPSNGKTKPSCWN